MNSQKLRQSARGEQCTMNVAGVCNHDPATVVLAHIDTEYKGMGLKSPDLCACFACSACHEWLDRHKGSEEDRLFYTLRAHFRTLKRWVDTGLLTIGKG